MSKSLLKKLEQLELHHKIGAFILIMVATILLTRFGVSIYDPNPILFNFELHHFDYGLALLFIVCLLLLFGKKKYVIYLPLAAISFGLILDELWFIRKSVFNPGQDDFSPYVTSYPSVILFILIIIFTIFLINHFTKKNKKNKVIN